MANIDNYQVKYWAGDNDFSYKSSKPKRSVGRKLIIVFSFLLLLALTPAVIYSLSNINFKHPPKVSVVESPEIIESKPESPKSVPVIITEPKETTNQTKVLNNDSYWKITKRVCGTGKFYLSVQAQNENRPLQRGDSVIVNCVL